MGVTLSISAKRGEMIMTTFEIVMSILNVLAVLLIPIVAVIIGQFLQDRAERRKDKMEIFKILMTNRFGWSVDSVRAMNIIEIVFADDEEVRTAWKEYHDKCCVENPTETELRKVQTANNKLLESIAKSLGYKDKVTWETIQNPYIPTGMIDAMNQQQQIQNGQVEWAKAVGTILQMMSSNSPQTQSQQEEAKANNHLDT